MGLMVRLAALVAPVLLASASAAFAQAAAAPVPRVTANALIDVVATYYRNLSGLDITNSRDKGWYSRERGLVTLTGEVGKTKGVLSLEHDFINGHVCCSFPLGPTAGASLDAETDEKAQSEVKWLYLETPITGPGALMGFVPVDTIGRFGAQPARGHDYKPGILFSGDFAGANFETIWAPTVRSRLTYASLGARLDPVVNGGGLDNYAYLASVEADLVKGFTIKPTFAWAHYRGGSEARGNFGTFARGGFNPNVFGPTAPASNPSQTNKIENRYTLGGDVRWTSGPWTFQPTFLYQWGTQEVDPARTNGKAAVDERSWIVDVTLGRRSGPLNLEARFLWTPGMKATQCVQRIEGVCDGGSTIRYFQPINSGTILYFAGWSEIEAAGIDYESPLHNGGVNSMTLGGNPSYDKYGRIIVAGAADYTVTPALVVHMTSVAQWTDTAVDTHGVRNVLVSNLVDPTIGSITPTGRGDARYLGTEVDLGFTYRFAPNVAFDMVGAALFVGPARDGARSVGDTRHGAQDVYKASTRVRVTW
jgi:hypothetical protein